MQVRGRVGNVFFSAGSTVRGCISAGWDNTAWAVDTVSISPGADNGMFNLMFWTNVTDNGNGNTEGFRIDYVQVMGEPIQSVSVVPLPASLPLLAGGLFGPGVLRRRRGASA